MHSNGLSLIYEEVAQHPHDLFFRYVRLYGAYYYAGRGVFRRVVVIA